MRRTAEGWSLSIRSAKPGWRIVASDATGKLVHEQPVGNADTPIKLSSAGPRVVKLLDGPRLVDATTLSP